MLNVSQLLSLKGKKQALSLVWHSSHRKDNDNKVHGTEGSLPPYKAIIKKMTNSSHITKRKQMKPSLLSPSDQNFTSLWTHHLRKINKQAYKIDKWSIHMNKRRTPVKKDTYKIILVLGQLYFHNKSASMQNMHGFKMFPECLNVSYLLAQRIFGEGGKDFQGESRICFATEPARNWEGEGGEAKKKQVTSLDYLPTIYC